MPKTGRMRRTARFLHTHPTRNYGWNWLIWTAAFLVLVGLAAGNDNSAAKKSTAATATLPAAAPSTTQDSTTSAAVSSASTAAATPATSTASSRAATSKPASSKAVPTPAETTGGYVVASSGAILPDPNRTPGVTNPDVTQANIHSTICVSGWTATVRPSSSYTTSLKERQLASGYAYKGDTNTGDYEEDHLISLELGGSPDAEANLWPEPYATTTGARTKDKVENRLHQMVCSGTITLAKAQQAIAKNWFTAYQLYVGVAPAPSTTKVYTPPPPPPTTKAYTPPPPPATTAPAPPMVVHPGAFCAPAGATGVTSAGTPMVCGPGSDGRNRWHHA